MTLYWEERARQELARLYACDVLESPLAERVDYPRAVALAHIGEMLDELLPDREPNDAIFRLAVSVLGTLHAGAIWMPLTYFDLWMVRLAGVLPDMRACAACGTTLNGSAAFFPAASWSSAAQAAGPSSAQAVESRSVSGVWRAT